MPSNDPRRVRSWPATLMVMSLLTMVMPGMERPAMSSPREPIARVLGIAPGMSERRAHAILALLGERVESAEDMDEEGAVGVEREVWRLFNPRYQWIQLAIDEHHRVKAIQASLRPGGPGLRYAEIGDVARARRFGYTILEWVVPGSAGQAGRRVTARGTDSVFAGSVAIVASD